MLISRSPGSNQQWLATSEHIVQYVFNTCLVGVHSYFHTQPYTTQI